MSRATRLLLNRSSARGRRRGWLERLRSRGDLEIVVTHSPEETTSAAADAAAEGLDRILVAGGDGTLHHAIRALAGTDCALGVVPTGSGNDLARALDLPLDPVDAAELARTGAPRIIDLGRIAGKPFFSVTGIGFSAEVNRFVNDRMERGRSRWAYPYAVLRTLRSFRAPSVRVEHDEGSYRGEVTMAVLANTPCFGGGMMVAPQAELDDGLLDLVIVDELPKLTMMRMLPRVYSGKHMSLSAVHARRVRSATVHAPSSLTFFGDGEALSPAADEGITIDVWPGALRVVGGAAEHAG